MCGHCEQTVQTYCTLANKKPSDLKQVATPCIDDHQLAPEDFETKGAVAAVASKIVSAGLYVGRMARPDFLWSVNTLAREVTKWNIACDKRLHRMISYIHHTKNWSQKCWVGDKIQDIKIMLFCDASFARELKGSKSTSGAVMCLVGPYTFVPVSYTHLTLPTILRV